MFAASALSCPVLLVAVLGQTSPLVLLGATLSVKLAASGRDRSAGMALALASIKPQLGATVIAAVLIWAGARRRWAIVGTFCRNDGRPRGGLDRGHARLAVVDGGRPRRTPVDTDAAPWIGTTWPLLLRTLGLSGTPLFLVRAGTAAALAAGMLVLALRPGSTIDRAADLGLTSAFFVAPYARPYDLCILIPPITWRLALLPRA